MQTTASFVIKHMRVLIAKVSKVDEIADRLQIPPEIDAYIKEEEKPKNKMWKLYQEVLIPEQIRKDIRADFYDALEDLEKDLLMKLGKRSATKSPLLMHLYA